MADSYSDGFESGSPLSTNYVDIADCGVVADGSFTGSFLVRPDSGAAARDKEFSQFTRAFAPSDLTLGFSVSGDYDFADLFHADPESSLIELLPTVLGGSYMLSVILRRTGGVAWLQVDYNGGISSSALGVLTVGTKTNIAVCGQFSTPSNLDGNVKVKVNGTTVITATGVSIDGIGYGGNVAWQAVRIKPMGRFDNLVIGQGCGLVSTDAATDQSTPCCDSKTGAGGGDVGTNADPIGDRPPWTASCIGGGAVDSVADLSDGEAW